MSMLVTDVVMKMLLLLTLIVVTGVQLADSTISSANLNSNIGQQETGNVEGMRDGGFSMDDRERVIAKVEANLLSLLGFSNRPRPQGHAHIPEVLKQVYKRQNSMGTTDIARPGIHAKSANTVRSFVHIESELDKKFPHYHRFRLQFDLSRVPKKERLQAAELSLSRISLGPNLAKEGPQFVRITVHDIVQPGIRGKTKPILRLIDSKVVDVRSNHSINLDVRPAVERWLSPKDGGVAHKGNHGLLVHIIGDEETKKLEHVRLRRSLDEDHESWKRVQPTLYAYMDDGRKEMATADKMLERRNRRAIMRKNRRKDGRRNCQRHPLYVDFAEVGWNDWIVAPPGYDAFYCHGDCPFPLSDHLNSTNHAIIQNLVHSTNPSLVPKACCAPTTLSSISILYLDDGNKAVLKNYPDMAVLDCGCI